MIAQAEKDLNDKWWFYYEFMKLHIGFNNLIILISILAMFNINIIIIDIHLLFIINHENFFSSFI